MIALSIDLRDNLSPALRAAAARTRPAISRGVKRAAQALVREWKLALSRGHTATTLGVVTGQLRSSVHTEMRDDLTAAVGTPMPYAAIHEYGGTIHMGARAHIKTKIAYRETTIHIPKRPHLAPAWQAALPQMHAAFEKSVGEALNG